MPASAFIWWAAEPPGDCLFLWNIYGGRRGRTRSEVIASSSEVGEAVVMTREDAPGEKHLVAYVSAKAEPGPAPEDLTAFLAQELPAYMVPSVMASSLPMEANQRLD